ncbi:MAG: hypothetical protein ACRDQ4_25165 [Pseudonocardiaceae bacterium]
MTDDPSARTARGNPRPTRAPRAPRRPHPDQGEITLLVSTSSQDTNPLDKLALSALLKVLARGMWLP